MGENLEQNTELWQRVLAEGHLGKNSLRRVMRMLPSAPRCKICNNPFAGVGGQVGRLVGLRPSRKNPRICALCCENMPRGGAEVETAILFADVRGSMKIAEELGPGRYADALNRFYASATETLIRHDATVDKLIGDEVMAFFVPGMAGPDFKRVAIEAGRDVLRKLGYGADGKAELPVGIGIDAGTAFVGNVGAEDFVDFTALGDPVNTASRIQSASRPGELLAGENVFSAVAERYPGARHRDVKVKGKAQAIRVYSLPVAE